MAEKRFGLPQEERIRKRTDFDHVFRTGRKISDRFIFGRYVNNDLGMTRMAIATPRRIGNAVRRNKVKRMLREAYRLNKRAFPNGVDIIFLPGFDWADDPPLSELEKSMVNIGGKLTAKMQPRNEDTKKAP